MWGVGGGGGGLVEGGTAAKIYNCPYELCTNCSRAIAHPRVYFQGWRPLKQDISHSQGQTKLLSTKIWKKNQVNKGCDGVFSTKFLIVFSHQRRKLQLCDCTYETLRLDLMYEKEKMDIMTKGYSFVNNNSCFREVILCCSQKWSGCPNLLNSFLNLSQKPRRSSALWVHFFFRQWMTSFVQRSIKLGSFFGARNQHFWSTDLSSHVLI